MAAPSSAVSNSAVSRGPRRPDFGPGQTRRGAQDPCEGCALRLVRVPFRRQTVTRSQQEHGVSKNSWLPELGCRCPPPPSRHRLPSNGRSIVCCQQLSCQQRPAAPGLRSRADQKRRARSLRRVRSPAGPGSLSAPDSNTESARTRSQQEHGVSKNTESARTRSQQE